MKGVGVVWGCCFPSSHPHPRASALAGKAVGRVPCVSAWMLLGVAGNRHARGAVRVTDPAAPMSGRARAGCGAGAFTRQLPSLLGPRPRSSGLLRIHYLLLTVGAGRGWGVVP